VTKIARVVRLCFLLGTVVLAPLKAQPAAGKDIEAQIKDFLAAWSQGDIGVPAMAGVFTTKTAAYLLDPFGDSASGWPAIQSLLHTRLTGLMDGSTFKILDEEPPIDVNATTRLQDWYVDLINMKGSNGSILPPLRMHVGVVWVIEGNDWRVKAAYCVVAAPLPQ
jgi:hypothetical protein